MDPSTFLIRKEKGFHPRAETSKISELIGRGNIMTIFPLSMADKHDHGGLPIPKPVSREDFSVATFPLPMTAFEYVFFRDDTVEYPTSFPIELRFSGWLVKSAFFAALEASLARHPMLTAMVDDTGAWPMWVERHGQSSSIDWDDDGRPIDHGDGVQIDLTSNAGIRIWVRRDITAEGPQTRVYLQVHHACCDGLAIESFIEDLLILYCQGIGACKPATQLRRLDNDLLRGRCGCLRTRMGRWAGCRRLIGTVVATAKTWGPLLRRHPSVIASSSSSSDSTPDFSDLFGFLTHTLSSDSICLLRRIATSHGVTTNDLLLRDLFRCLAKWNREHDDTSNGWLRINMPSNERGLADRAMPAANRLSFTFLTRRAAACHDRSRLLIEIHDETDAIKRSRLGQYFLAGLEMASRIPPVIPWFLRRERSFATICLSNVGRVLGRTPLPREQKQIRCGGAVLKRIAGTPFIRPFTRAAITVIHYANEITINLRCDPRYFSPAQRKSFLAHYAAMIEQTLECGC